MEYLHKVDRRVNDVTIMSCVNGSVKNTEVVLMLICIYMTVYVRMLQCEVKTPSACYINCGKAATGHP